MHNRLNTDELRDKIYLFKNGVESLYRYGDPGNSKIFFNTLSNDDQKRLLYWALIESDEDIKIIAKYFMQQLNPAPKDEKELLAQMKPSDRGEIEAILSQFDKYQVDTELLEVSKKKIDEILAEACGKIGFVDIEEAFWVLIPSDLSQKATWLRAKGIAGNNISSYIGLPNCVYYEPEKREQYKLLSMMRESLLILHIHNHPTTPDTIYGASTNDRNFAKHWKYLRKELITKMYFFIIQQKTAFEYREEGEDVQWLGEKIQSKPLSEKESEKEYYEKQFPLDVAKKMLKERRKKFYDKLFGNE
jgi:hypothetical protein